MRFFTSLHIMKQRSSLKIFFFQPIQLWTTSKLQRRADLSSKPDCQESPCLQPPLTNRWVRDGCPDETAVRYQGDQPLHQGHNTSPPSL